MMKPETTKSADQREKGGGQPIQSFLLVKHFKSSLAVKVSRAVRSLTDRLAGQLVEKLEVSQTPNNQSLITGWETA